MRTVVIKMFETIAHFTLALVPGTSKLGHFKQKPKHTGSETTEYESTPNLEMLHAANMIAVL